MSEQKIDVTDETLTESIEHTKSGFGLGARLRGYFIAGILVTAPISFTLYLAWLIIDFVDGQVTALIPPHYNPENYLPFSVPGLGLVIAILSLLLIGFLTANFLGRFFIRISEAVLARMPIIRSVYAATKQIMETVLASQSQAFRDVCLVEYPRKGMWVLGFLTGKTTGEVQVKTKKVMRNVFIPTTPNPTSGFLIFVAEEEIHRLDMTVEEGIKMVVSAGIVTPPYRGEKPASAQKKTVKGVKKTVKAKVTKPKAKK